MIATLQCPSKCTNDNKSQLKSIGHSNHVRFVFQEQKNCSLICLITIFCERMFSLSIDDTHQLPQFFRLGASSQSEQFSFKSHQSEQFSFKSQSSNACKERHCKCTYRMRTINDFTNLMNHSKFSHKPRDSIIDYIATSCFIAAPSCTIVDVKYFHNCFGCGSYVLSAVFSY